MEDSKGKRQAMAMAVAIRKHAMKKKMAQGGMVENEKLHPEVEAPKTAERMVMRSEKPQSSGMMSDPKSMAASILSRKMSKGGGLSVEEGRDLSIDENDDDPRDVFLTADMPAVETGSEHAADLDEEEMDPVARRRSMLSGIMGRLSGRK